MYTNVQIKVVMYISIPRTLIKAMPNEFTLVSEDGIKFQVTMHLVRCIGLFKNLLELKLNSGLSVSGNEVQNSILQVPNVNSLILDKIIEYLNNYVASKENSSLTKLMNSSSSSKTKTSLSVKSIVSGIQNSINDDGDDDEDDSLNCNLTKVNQEKEGDDTDIDEFEMISCEEEEEEEEENAFDFVNFDEQSLKLFTPYEQNFFGSLDIPTLIEITKVNL